jgi:hypothetical protein
MEQREGTDTPVYVLPEVTITGSIDWGVGSFDASFDNIPSEIGISYDQNYEIRQAYMFLASQAIRLSTFSSVCKNPLVSGDTRKTTSADDTTARWLATQDVFNKMALQKGAIEFYTQSAVPITLLIDNKTYAGFKVFYSDGFSEVWVVNPGWQTSSLRVFDTPIPDSLVLNKNAPTCRPVE